MEEAFKETKEKLIGIMSESILAKKWVENKNAELLKEDRGTMVDEMSAVRNQSTVIELKKKPERPEVEGEEPEPIKLSEQDEALLRELRAKNQELNDKIQLFDTTLERLKGFQNSIDESVFQYKNFDTSVEEIKELIK